MLLALLALGLGHAPGMSTGGGPYPSVPCVQCGQLLVAGTQFCGQCGATQPRPSVSPGTPVAPAMQAPQPAFGARTVMQLSPSPAPGPGAAQAAAPAPLPLSPAPSPPAASPPSAASASRPLHQTMLGFGGPLPGGAPQSAPGGGSLPALTQPLTPPTGPAAAFPALTQQLTPPSAPLAGPVAPGPRPGAINKTMIGVAVPGIAPTAPPDQDAPPGRAPIPAPAPQPQRPLALTMPLQVQYVPPPDPLQELPVPAPPRIVQSKRGFPLAAVGLTMGVLVLVGGVVLAVLWKGSPPITGQPRATPEGRDVLHLVCDPKSCKDGTVVTLDGAKATFAQGEADLTLAAPLHVGDNDLRLAVDRPGMGRDETVKLVVPVAYRVSADVSTMSGPKPAITVRVAAHTGADVTVDGKPVTLDASGAAAYAIDESVAADGPADESRVVSVDVPYTVTTQGRTDKGTVSARVAVAPLRVDAPGVRAIVEDDKTTIAGRAAKGATVTVDGNPVTLGADGSFSTTVPLPSLGDRTIDVRGGTAGAAPMSPRTVHVVVTRVASLADAAKTFEQQKTIGYDAAMANITGSAGQPIVVEGAVVESRASGPKTIVLVDDKRGCAKGPCLTRVVVGREMPLARGDVLRAYGIVARGFTTPAQQTVPEVEAAFAIKAKR
jgi:hypothetical protein